MKNSESIRAFKSIYIPLVAVLFLTLFSDNGQAAVYRAQVDCSHSSLTQTQTSNRITATFRASGGRVISRVVRNGITNCSSPANFTINTNDVVSMVSFSTNGNDAFFIDRWSLYLNGRMIQSDGAQNNRGWCLSTDSRDTNGAWRSYIRGGCQRTLNFSIRSTSSTTLYSVMIDCSHSSIVNENTQNRISVALLDSNRRVIGSAFKNGITNCNNSNYFRINASRAPSFVRISTNGNDAFYIDRWELFRGTTLIRRNGVNERTGWCLSTDSGDTGAWRRYLTGDCQRSFQFPVRGTGTGTGGGMGTPTGTAYNVMLDCSHSSIVNENTTNRIAVSLLDSDRRVIGTTSKSGIQSCATNAVFRITTSSVPQYVRVSTSGNDAYYIDRWALYRGRTLITRRGVDNGDGWCLSTDQRDTRAWQSHLTSTCRQLIQFPLATGTGIGTGSGGADAPRYSVMLDCGHDSIVNENTTNLITVALLDSSGRVLGRSAKRGIRSCTANSFFRINTSGTPETIRVTTNGNDAYYIDRWELYRGNRLIKRNGVQNRKGWCLSTDSRDTAAWSQVTNGSCRSTIDFSVGGGNTGGTTNLYSLMLDCSHSALNNENTTNRITVTLLDRNGRQVGRASKNGIRSCSTKTFFRVNSTGTPSFVQVSTNGNDAFYIDRWELYRGNRLIKRGGTENRNGWCLSTDSGDTGAWQRNLNGSCRDMLEFPV